MECPICGGRTRVIDKREPKEFIGVVHRTRECVECFTRIKSSEKLIFSSLPAYIREKFLSEGKRK